MSLPIDSPNKSPLGESTAVVAFQQDPPSHIFNNKWFNLSLTLSLHRLRFRDQIPECNVKLQPQLLRCVNKDTYPLSPNDTVEFEMDPQTLTLPISSSSAASKPVVTEARCKISCPQNRRMEQSFIIEFRETWSESSNTGIKVNPVKSKKMTVVDARLEVSAIEWDKVSVKDANDKVWYKDMGGKDNAMQVTVTLKDQNGEAVRNQKVPLRLDLLYDNEQRSRVMKQEILRTIGSRNPAIDPNTGKATVQFRIEQVSKNHQNQDFLLQLSDDRTNHSHIQPGVTRPVTVRSKIKGSSKTTKAQQYQQQYQQQPIPPQTPQDFPSVFQQRSYHPSNPATIRNAMRGVIEWTEEVLNGLHQLKWNHIGYEQLQDGTYDRFHPLYQMQNPNDTINKIMSMYESQTRENMRVLIQSIDSTAPASNDPFGARNTALHLPSTTNHRGTKRPRSHVDPQGQFQFQYQNDISSQGSLSQSQGMQVQNFMQRGPVFNQPNQFIMQQQHQLQQQQQQQQQQRYQFAPQFPYSHTSTDQNEEDQFVDAEYRQGEVQYILARPFTHSGKQLGYPAYSLTKALLGFYRKSSRDGVGPRFVPIHKHELHTREMEQATKILDDAILQGDRRVLNIHHYQNLTEVVNEALSYERWPKTTGESTTTGHVDIGLAGDNSPESF